MNRDYDVIVVGSGAAGLSAAIAAADAGASVLVMEADRQVGGSSRLSGGHFYAAGTSVQSQAGIDDTADAMFEHYMTLNQWMVEPSVVRRYCDLSGPTLDWLRDLGVEFSPSGVYASGVGRTPRGHQPTGEGAAVIQVLDANCANRQIDIVLDSRVDELLQNEAGDVVGVRSGTDRASSGAVVVATGGFGANPEMVAEHFPDAAAGGDWTWYIGSPMAQGDGLKLGGAVGAAIDGHNRGLLLATPGFSRDLEVLLPGWLILVDRLGRRFVDETASYTVLAGLIKRHGHGVYAVFDEKARAGARRSAFFQAFWVDEVLAEKAKEGVIKRADSLEELAGRIDVDAAALAGTVERYNADCLVGTDSAFFKPPASGMQTIDTPPFYGAEIRPAFVCWTGTGLRIDAATRVLGTDERPIPGLYAAGETVGSLHGDRYIGGGGSFGPCIVFGRLAGERAAHHAGRLGSDSVGNRSVDQQIGR